MYLYLPNVRLFNNNIRIFPRISFSHVSSWVILLLQVLILCYLFLVVLKRFFSSKTVEVAVFCGCCLCNVTSPLKSATPNPSSVAHVTTSHLTRITPTTQCITHSFSNFCTVHKIIRFHSAVDHHYPNVWWVGEGSVRLMVVDVCELKI